MAIGTGSDVAIGAADLTLVNGDPASIADAVLLSRATLRTIHANLTWAFGYNVIAIPLAALGYLNPLFAGLAMAGSSLVVVSNSLRLRRFRASRPGARPAAAPGGAAPGQRGRVGAVTAQQAAEAPAAQTRPPGPGRPRGSGAGLVRAALAPVICAAALIGLLSAWVATGGAGTVSRVTIRIGQAAVALPSSSAPDQAATFLTITNLGGPDTLLSVRSPAAAGWCSSGMTAAPRARGLRCARWRYRPMGRCR